MNAPLLIRADSDIRTGTGHVMRCLALAQGWLPRDTVVFLSSAETACLADDIQSRGCELRAISGLPGSHQDARETIAAARSLHCAWVVADGYHFDGEYQRWLKDAGLKLLLLDDYGHTDEYSGDLLLNQNISADPNWYAHRQSYTRLLLGTRYALLRREFTRWMQWRRQPAASPRNVLVTLGGSDPDNATLLVLRALAGLQRPDLHVRCVVGAANPHRALLESFVSGAPCRMELIFAKVAMPELTMWADIAAAAAGGTCWELLFMQLPAVILSIAPNQRPAARRLGEAGLALALDWSSTLPPEAVVASLRQLLQDEPLRIKIAQKGREYVDGGGAQRVIAEMLAPDDLILRTANERDCRLLWEWANDPGVRRVSFSRRDGTIPWDEHQRWFTRRLQDSQTLFYVAEINHQPVGQLRYDLGPGGHEAGGPTAANNGAGLEATVSVSLAAESRGRGYGVQLLKLGSEMVFSTTLAETIHAYIAPENEISARVFAKAGFLRAGSAEIRGQQALHFLQKAAHCS